MSRLEKLRSSFLACQGDYQWRDFEALLGQLGYELFKLSGGTGGSRRRFIHPGTGHVIMLHEPHDGIMGFGMVKRLRTELREKGKI